MASKRDKEAERRAKAKENSDKRRAKIEAQRDKIRAKREKREMKEDAVYLNSIGRVFKRLILAIVEFIIVFLLVTLLMNYMNTGTIDIENVPKLLETYLQPGQPIFTALVSYLPIMVIESIGVYFGLGSVPRMIFGVAKCIVLAVWIQIFAAAAGDIDIIKLAGMSESSSLQGLEGMTVNIQPLSRLLSIIFMLCCIIPIGEFIGCRARHNEAVIRNEERQEKIAEKREEEKIAAMEAKAAKKDEKEAKKAAKRDAKAAKKAGVAAGAAVVAAEAVSEEGSADAAETPAEEAPAESDAEAPAEDAPEPVADAPAEEAPAEDAAEPAEDVPRSVQESDVRREAEDSEKDKKIDVDDW